MSPSRSSLVDFPVRDPRRNIRTLGVIPERHNRDTDPIQHFPRLVLGEHLDHVPELADQSCGVSQVPLHTPHPIFFMPSQLPHGPLRRRQFRRCHHLQPFLCRPVMVRGIPTTTRKPLPVCQCVKWGETGSYPPDRVRSCRRHSRTRLSLERDGSSFRTGRPTFALCALVGNLRGMLADAACQP